MPKDSSVIAEIASDIARSHAPLRWHDRVTPEHAAKLEEILNAWRAGKLGNKRRTAARSIMKWLNANNVSTVGVQGVEEWLERA